MSVIQIMVTIIIVTILVTVILGVASYAAYWLRRGRQPAEAVEVDESPRFFYRYVHEAEAAVEEEAPPLDDAESAEAGVPELAVSVADGNGRTGL
jgi:Tfp pilus assembly protein PilE